MKPLQRKCRLHEKVILEVLNNAEWHKIHWEVEAPIKWRIIEPISHTLHIALLDTIDKMPLRKDEP